MKYISLIMFLIILTGCTSQTPLGKCIGINDKPDVTFEYKYNVWNIFLGVMFAETIIVPLEVTFNQLQCPESKK